jgi:cell fate regulator YaaT (PSP1 superfamily)
MAQLLLESHPLPIKLVTAECQFDRNKITIYYDTQVTRVDFREFVRDLYSTFKTRIWMQKVEAKYPFIPKRYASHALICGAEVQF